MALVSNGGMTPPPELVREWSLHTAHEPAVEANWQQIAAKAAQWGADAELEACCEWFVRDWTDIETADKLRMARRPKRINLKRVALLQLEQLDAGRAGDVIRQALEQLPDD